MKNNTSNSIEDFVVVQRVVNNEIADKNAHNSRESSPFKLVHDPKPKVDDSNQQGDNLVSSVPLYSARLDNAERLDSPRSNSRESSPFELVDDPKPKVDDSNQQGDNLVSSVPIYSPQLGDAARLNSLRSNDGKDDGKGKDGGCRIS